MKTILTILLGISMAGNAISVWYFTGSGIAAHGNAAESKKGVADAHDATASGGARTTLAQQPNAALAGTWSRINAGGDLAATVANLRAAGFPRGVIQAAAERLVAEKLAATNPYNTVPYWRQGRNAELDAALAAHANEQAALLASVLGPDATLSARLTPLERKRRYGDLSDAQIDAVDRIEKDYRELHSKSLVSLRPADGEKMIREMHLLEEEKHRDLAAILSPDELRAFQMRSTPTAFMVMTQTKNLQITEQQYEALFDLQQSYEDRDKPLRLDPTARAERGALRREHIDSISRVLDEEQLHQYLHDADPSYDFVGKFTTSHSLPLQTQYALYRLYLEAQETSLQRESVLPAAERRNSISQLNQRLEQLLGADLAAAYRKANATLFNPPPPPQATLGHAGGG